MESMAAAQISVMERFISEVVLAQEYVVLS